MSKKMLQEEYYNATYFLFLKKLNRNDFYEKKCI